MIVHAEGGRLRLVTQTDHAAFAAELLSLWRADGLPGEPRRAELLFATREHDNGWRETDAAPAVDPASGRPRDFLTLPRAERHRLWRRGVERFAAARPWAALLVAEHALHLLAEGDPDEERRAVLDALAERRRELAEAAAAGDAEIARIYGFLELADRASLAVCRASTEPFSGAGHDGQWTPDGLVLAPFPLAGATSFRIACRHLPDRPWSGDAELGGALAAARWESFTVRVVPP